VPRDSGIEHGDRFDLDQQLWEREAQHRVVAFVATSLEAFEPTG